MKIRDSGSRSLVPTCNDRPANVRCSLLHRRSKCRARSSSRRVAPIERPARVCGRSSPAPICRWRTGERWLDTVWACAANSTTSGWVWPTRTCKNCSCRSQASCGRVCRIWTSAGCWANAWRPDRSERRLWRSGRVGRKMGADAKLNVSEMPIGVRGREKRQGKQPISIGKW